MIDIKNLICNTCTKFQDDQGHVKCPILRDLLYSLRNSDMTADQVIRLSNLNITFACNAYTEAPIG